MTEARDRRDRQKRVICATGIACEHVYGCAWNDLRRLGVVRVRSWDLTSVALHPAGVVVVVARPSHKDYGHI